MTDRVAQLAFLDPRRNDLYFCRTDCARDDRAARREPCPECVRAARQETVGHLTFRKWKD